MLIDLESLEADEGSERGAPGFTGVCVNVEACERAHMRDDCLLKLPRLPEGPDSQMDCAELGTMLRTGGQHTRHIGSLRLWGEVQAEVREGLTRLAGSL